MLDSTALLAPISAAQPSGDDLSFSSDFDAIAEARRFDDPTLDQGEWITSIKEADWTSVIHACHDLLINRTKDLRLAAWLTEALAKTQGFGGFGAGLQLTTALIDAFWSTLHPRSDDASDVEERVGALRWLTTRSMQLVRELPLIESPGASYSLVDIDTARALSAHLERTGEAPPEGRLTMPMFEAARKKMSRHAFANAVRDTAFAAQALKALETAVDAKLGDQGPSFSSARRAFDDVIASIERFARDAGVTTRHSMHGAAHSNASVAAGTNMNANPTSAGSLTDMPAARINDACTADASHALDQHLGASAHGPIATRAQAVEQLRAIADFFRRTEPHSPVAYVADKAAQWAEMPLHAWLRAVIKDQTALSQLDELLGVDPPVRDRDS